MAVESRAIVAHSSRITGFHRLNVEQRREALRQHGILNATELANLESGGIDCATANSMIENVIGTHALPLGVALNIRINDKDYVVPMAIEEPSVVAAASNAAKMIRACGGFRAEVTAPVMIGQVELRDITDSQAAVIALRAATDDILIRARSEMVSLTARGGGPTGIEIRVLDPTRLVVHLLVDCRDAMGANLVNTLCESLAPTLAEIAGGSVGLRILSNLADHRLVTIRARVGDDQLGGCKVRSQIAAASDFADLDPYRATTHNKGVDAVLVACGQDWRGVEAGAHAFAARDGRYRPLATWQDNGTELCGEMTLPMAIGIVGGALHLHRGAQSALALLAVESASELASVVAATGLAANLAALRALATDGIQRGHMLLHARSVARGAGATGEFIERVAEEIAALGDVKPDRARQVLKRLTRGNPTNLSAISSENMSSKESS